MFYRSLIDGVTYRESNVKTSHFREEFHDFLAGANGYPLLELGKRAPKMDFLQERRKRKMADLWVLVADSSRARIFGTDGAGAKLNELEDLAHPEGHLHEVELTSDLPGRTFDRFGQGRHAMEEDTSPKRHEAIVFAKRIASRLETGRNNKEFSRLILVAEPRFLGILRDSLSAECMRLTSLQIDKNLVQLDSGEIRSRLPERL